MSGTITFSDAGKERYGFTDHGASRLELTEASGARYVFEDNSRSRLNAPDESGTP